MKPWMKCISYVLWFVGLVVLSNVAYRYSLHLQQAAHSDLIYSRQEARIQWYQFITLVLFGAYSSVLFIRSWHIRPNIPLLLCICLPTLLLSIWNPLVLTTMPRNGSSPIPFPAWVGITTSFNLPQFICGFTLLYGLMTSNSKHTG